MYMRIERPPMLTHFIEKGNYFDYTTLYLELFRVILNDVIVTRKYEMQLDVIN